MKPRSGTVLLSSLLATGLAMGCHARGGHGEPAPDPGLFPHDARLYSVLAAQPGLAQLDSLRQLEERTGWELTDTLAEIIEDRALHPQLRANAVWLLGKMHAVQPVAQLKPLLEDPDERVRLAVVAAAGESLPDRHESAMAVLRHALNDPSPDVQARVLEAMTDRDIDLLRAWLRRPPVTQLIPIVQDLVAAAEERGAPLEPDASGVLQRTSPVGHTLTFRPVKQWPEWRIAYGELALRTAQNATVVLGNDLEVVQDVVPAFFSGDGRFLVYEKARRIIVREMATGTERTLGRGIAPRPIPFTEDFVFAREIEDARTEERAGSRLQYELVRESFAMLANDTTGEIIGLMATNVSFDVAGAASPVRWMRVQEKSDGSGFQLTGQGFDPVALPGPMGLTERVR
jgi:hypothetical protein